MIRILCSLMSVTLILTFVLTGCINQSASGTGEWNSKTYTFSIENEKLTYTLPTEPSFWAIADKDNLPSDMLFFGVDSSEGIGVGIFRPNLDVIHTKKAKDFTDTDIEVILKQLSSPQQGQNVVYEKIAKSKRDCEGKVEWDFKVEHKILDTAVSHDTISVHYSGYIFDGIMNTYGIVIISNIDPANVEGQIQMNKYILGLMRH